MIRPGEVFIAVFDQAGPHPVIVVSREDLNRGRYALVVVCTSAKAEGDTATRPRGTFLILAASDEGWEDAAS